MTMNKIVFGDNRITMKQLIDEGVKVQMCVTSPPYYGLRDYGTGTWEGGDPNCSHKRDSKTSDKCITGHVNLEGAVGDGIYKDVCPRCNAKRKDLQIGLEQTPEDYIKEMVNVFRLVKDLLTDDGVIWVNIGDSYSSYKDCKSIGQTLAKGTNREDAHVLDKGSSPTRNTKMLKSQGLKNKDLIGIPWMLAFALRADGWYLRQDIIWHKPNPMPESVTDRCTKAHEYIFLLSKSDKYFFDSDAIKEEGVTPAGTKAAKGSAERLKEKGVNSRPAEYKIYDGMRNKRSVWTVNTKPYKGAHFATFPKNLIEPCIKAGCPEKICISCNTPYKRQKKVERNLTLDEVAEIRKNIVESNKDKKPYAILEEEFRNQVIEYRNLPNHDEMREYLQFNRHLQELTIDQIETSFGTQAPHHWFEKGGSYPSKEDWIKLKEMLLLDDKYDQAMTEVFYKSGLKCANNYIDGGLVKQCQCDTNETKTGIVFDPFMGSGTTAQVALELGRQYLGCELNPNYEALQQERINSATPQLEDDSQFDLFKETA
jgi:DNA modification methylase